MKARIGLVLAAVAGGLAACATPPAPAPVPVAPPTERTAPVVAAPALPPLIESPPLEPVEPPAASAAAPLAGVASTAAAPVTEPVAAPVVEPVAEPAAAPVVPPAPEAVEAPATAPPPAPLEPTEERQLASLLADLQRFGALNADEVRRELGSATQLLSRQRTDFNRIRLAVLHTLVKTPQDDQRAMQLLDSVAKNNPGSPAAKQLAAVVQVQVAERMRAVRDEQQKADAAVKKLEALRNMERDLLRDRIRSGGGGAGGGSSGGGGGGGG